MELDHKETFYVLRVSGEELNKMYWSLHDHPCNTCKRPNIKGCSPGDCIKLMEQLKYETADKRI